MEEGQEFRCPVCGFVGLHGPARSASGGGSYEFCPSCDFEFGVTDDDLGYTDDDWRQKWIAEGTPWCSKSRPQPSGWNPVGQLRNLRETR
jgi:hypothetical protein